MGESQKDTIEFFEGRCCVCFRPMIQKETGRPRLTCSDRCRSTLKRMRNKGKDPVKTLAGAKLKDGEMTEGEGYNAPVVGLCLTCGKAIRQAKTGRRRETCSNACRQKLWRLRHPVCPACGKRFAVTPGQARMRYCSTACKVRVRLARRWIEELKRRERKYARRPEWWPAKGTGWRMEAVPAGAVTRRRRLARGEGDVAGDGMDWAAAEALDWGEYEDESGMTEAEKIAMEMRYFEGG